MSRAPNKVTQSWLLPTRMHPRTVAHRRMCQELSATPREVMAVAAVVWACFPGAQYAVVHEFRVPVVVKSVLAKRGVFVRTVPGT